MRWKIGDRVLVCGKHPGTIVDFFESYGRRTYTVRFDDAYMARIPPQVAVSVLEQDLEPELGADGHGPARSGTARHCGAWPGEQR